MILYIKPPASALSFGIVSGRRRIEGLVGFVVPVNIVTYNKVEKSKIVNYSQFVFISMAENMVIMQKIEAPFPPEKRQIQGHNDRLGSPNVFHPLNLDRNTYSTEDNELGFYKVHFEQNDVSFGIRVLAQRKFGC